MRKILLLIVASALIICALGCNNNSNQTPTAKVSGVPNSAVATVDGLPITKAEYQSYLHNQFGGQALRSLAQEKILEAWAKEEGVTPTKEQYDKEIERLKEDDQYDDLLENLGEDGLKMIINDQLLRANLSKKLKAPTEEEIKKFYEANKAQYSHGPRKLSIVILGQDKATLEEVYKEIENISDAKKVKEKVKELAEKYDVDKKPRVGSLWIADDSLGVPKEIVKSIKDMQVGDLSKVGEIKDDNSPSLFYILKVKDSQDKVEKKLEDVKDEIIDNLALNNINTNPDFTEKLIEKTENADIVINIDKYKDLVDMIKHPMGMGGMVPQAAPQPAPAPTPKKK